NMDVIPCLKRVSVSCSLAWPNLISSNSHYLSVRLPCAAQNPKLAIPTVSYEGNHLYHNGNRDGRRFSLQTRLSFFYRFYGCFTGLSRKSGKGRWPQVHGLPRQSLRYMTEPMYRGTD